MRCCVLVVVLCSLGCGRRMADYTHDGLIVNLYSDEEVRRIAGYNPDKQEEPNKPARTILDLPYHEVVAGGTSRSRDEVFRGLGIDDRRIRPVQWWPEGRVIFLRWQLSESYDLICMTSAEPADRMPE